MKAAVILAAVIASPLDEFLLIAVFYLIRKFVSGKAGAANPRHKMIGAIR